MSGPFAPGSVHGGWRVAGPPPEGALHRWPVDRDGRTGTLTFFPSGGARADVHRAVVQKHAAWRKLEHEALLRVDTGQVEGGAYVVLPPLGHLPEGPLPPDEALAVLERVAQALEVFHAEGLAHGEVDAWSVVLGEDGAASLLPPGLRGPPPGLEGLGLHADPRYAAPEVLDGRPATAESDLYSLGLVLYRLLTGQGPAQGGEPLEVLVARGQVPAPDLPPATAPRLVALYRCLTAKRGQRPRDASAALGLVRQVRKGATPAAPERVVRPVRPASISGPLLALVALAGAAVLGWSLLEARFAPPAAPFDEFHFRTAQPGDGR